MARESSPLRLRLNKQIIMGLDPPDPPTDRYYCYDLNTPTLALCVTKTGAKSFYCYRRMEGRPERVLLGKWPVMTLEQAKTAVANLNGQIANGRNPAAEKRTIRAAMTLGELWTYYLENHAKPRKRSWKTDEWLYTKFLKEWESKRINQIRKADFHQLHVKLGKDSITNANRTRSLLMTMYSVATDNGYEGVNPVHGVKPFKEVKRERYLSAEELARLFKALDAEPNQLLADAMRFGLWTGARRGNWLSARWDEIDLNRQVWTIPSSKAKAGKSIVVPLAKQAIEILERRKADEHGSPEWVFPSRYGDDHATTIKSAWKRVREAAKIPDIRLHDLRRTTATFAVAAGAPLFHVAKLLGHSTTAVTESVYARQQDAGLRAAVDAASAAMEAAINPKEEKPKAKAKPKGKGKAKGGDNG